MLDRQTLQECIDLVDNMRIIYEKAGSENKITAYNASFLNGEVTGITMVENLLYEILLKTYEHDNK